MELEFLELAVVESLHPALVGNALDAIQVFGQ
jgi:hypothetical protein